jgi:hypothetical protein
MAGFESTFRLRWSSCVEPVPVPNEGPNSRWTSDSASSAGMPEVNCSVPAEVETFARPPANTTVTSRNATMMRPGRSVISVVVAATSRSAFISLGVRRDRHRGR